MSAVDTDWQSICHEASHLPEEAGAALEARIAANADDIDARVKLVGFYYLGKQALQCRRGAHLLWLATHRPEIHLGGFGSLIDDWAPVEHAALLAAWRAQAAKPDATATVLDSAASFIGFPHRNASEVEALYRRAAALEPSDEEWRERLGLLLSRNAESAEGAERRTIARSAAAEYEMALTLTTSASTMLLIREHQLKPLSIAEDWGRAVALAERILIDNESDPGSWNYGNVIHHANLALGCAAHARGDLPAAGHFLVRAGETPGSPQLDSFGPNRELAEALLVAGERATVRIYLESCRRFWKMDRGNLDRWLTAIGTGSTTLERYYGEDDT